MKIFDAAAQHAIIPVSLLATFDLSCPITGYLLSISYRIINSEISYIISGHLI